MRKRWPNAAPYGIVHLLRAAELSRVLSSYRAAQTTSWRACPRESIRVHRMRNHRSDTYERQITAKANNSTWRGTKSLLSLLDFSFISVTSVSSVVPSFCFPMAATFPQRVTRAASPCFAPCLLHGATRLPAMRRGTGWTTVELMAEMKNRKPRFPLVKPVRRPGDNERVCPVPSRLTVHRRAARATMARARIPRPLRALRLR